MTKKSIKKFRKHLGRLLEEDRSVSLSRFIPTDQTVPSRRRGSTKGSDSSSSSSDNEEIAEEQKQEISLPTIPPPIPTPATHSSTSSQSPSPPLLPMITSSNSEKDEIVIPPPPLAMRRFPSVADTIASPLPHGKVVDNVLKKIQVRLNEMALQKQIDEEEEKKIEEEERQQMKVSPSKGLFPKKLSKVIIVGSGAFNPIHKLHLRNFFLAKQFLESHSHCEVVGGLLSPSHQTMVRQKNRRTKSEIIPDGHRLSMARLMVGSSSWLTVDPWEMTRRRVMDYMSVLEHVNFIIKEKFPSETIKIVYLCKGRQVLKLSPTSLKNGGFMCLCLCRPLDVDYVSSQVGSSWSGTIVLVEDGAILSAQLENITSGKIRSRLKKGQSVDSMVGPQVADYMAKHSMGRKMAGLDRWSNDDLKVIRNFTDDHDKPYHREPAKKRRGSLRNNKPKWE